MNVMELTIAMPHLRPYRSEMFGSSKVPTTPPAWNSPLVVEMRSVPFSRVSSSK